MNKLDLRIIHTHDTEANWKNHKDFIPNAGEIIVYDIDGTYSYERFKIGDGINTLEKLPFTVNNLIESIFNIVDNTIYADAGRITTYNK